MPKKTVTPTQYAQKSISEIVSVIRCDWKNVHFGAAPYLRAMGTLDSIGDRFGEDSGKSIVAYFLCNATTWRGPVAKEVKLELNRRIK